MRRKKLILFTIIAVIFALLLTLEIVTASNYKMMVNVVRESNVIGVNPSVESLDFGDLSRNIGVERYINLQNDGNLTFYAVVVKTGELGRLVKVKNSIIKVGPNEEAQLAFKLNIPFSAEEKRYEGKVTIFYIPKII